jgi:hypothetical protein
MAYSNCPDCGAETYSDNYLYVGNHAAYDKGYEDSGFKIVGYRFRCEELIEPDEEICGKVWET